MQQMDLIWTRFGWGLATALVFGILYALLVRWVATHRGMEGQTAWSVVIGVTATLLAMLWVFQIEDIAIIFCFFIASGTPMIIEYLLRVQAEMQKDQKEANDLAKDLLNHDSQARNR